MTIRTLSLALLCCLFLAAPGPGQEPPPIAAIGEEISVSEVLLDARVHDRQGHAVLGLAAEDFRLEIGGREVPLASATFYSTRRFLGGEDEAARRRLAELEPTEQRLFVLFFHDQRLESGPDLSLTRELLDAGRSAAAWLEGGLSPGDWVAVASFDVKLKLHADFTRDLAALKRAVSAATSGGEGELQWPSRRAAPGAAPSLAAGLPAGEALRDATPRIYDALRLLGEAATSIRGRKNLVLFSAGFGDRGAFGQYRPDTRFHAAMRDALARGNVAVFAVDTASRVARLPEGQALDQLASETGGEVQRQFVSFATALERIDRETNGYYLLAFAPPEGVEAGTYQRLRLTVRNPELRVTVREGLRFEGP
ncbi:MAG: VWA domain-containing protein [Thermoanaerobaculia bacterium]|nr:VWA domain-containing protein [Thermoanaerobaculia bacterium]